MPDEFTCAQCGGTFDKEWSDEEALAEAAENFGEIDDPVVICDDCYKRMIAWLPPMQWKEDHVVLCRPPIHGASAWFEDAVARGLIAYGTTRVSDA